MARILADAGYRTVCCTPHNIRGAWGNLSSVQVRQAVTELQDELQRAGIELQLLPGREYYLDEYLLDELNDPLLLPGGLLLVELPNQCDPGQVRDTLFQLVRRKFTPMIAHPERNPLLAAPTLEKLGLFSRLNLAVNSKFKIQNLKLQPNPLLSYLQELGCQFQANIGSFTGAYGEPVRKNALALLDSGVYTHLGSDAHSTAHLARTLSDGLREVERLAGPDTLQKMLGHAIS